MTIDNVWRVGEHNEFTSSSYERPENLKQFNRFGREMVIDWKGDRVNPYFDPTGLPGINNENWVKPPNPWDSHDYDIDLTHNGSGAWCSTTSDCAAGYGCIGGKCASLSITSQGGGYGGGGSGCGSDGTECNTGGGCSSYRNCGDGNSAAPSTSRCCGHEVVVEWRNGTRVRLCEFKFGRPDRCDSTCDSVGALFGDADFCEGKSCPECEECSLGSCRPLFAQYAPCWCTGCGNCSTCDEASGECLLDRSSECYVCTEVVCDCKCGVTATSQGCGYSIPAARGDARNNCAEACGRTLAGTDPNACCPEGDFALKETQWRTTVDGEPGRITVRTDGSAPSMYNHPNGFSYGQFTTPCGNVQLAWITGCSWSSHSCGWARVLGPYDTCCDCASEAGDGECNRNGIPGNFPPAPPP